MPLSESAMLSKLEGDISSGSSVSSSQTSRRRASRVSVGFRHALDWAGHGVNFQTGATSSGMSNWIGGGIDAARAGVIARLVGEDRGTGKLTGQDPDRIMSPRDYRGQERIEYLVAAHNVRGMGGNINPTVPTRRWIYGRPNYGESVFPRHTAGDAKQPQLEKLMSHYISRSSGSFQGSGSAMQPINRIWGAFWNRFENYMRTEAEDELRNIYQQLDESDEGLGYTTEGMDVVLDRLDREGRIQGDSFQEIASDLGREMAHTTDLGEGAHRQLGGAQRFDQVFESGTTFPTLSGEDIEIKRIADIEEGGWFAKKPHHGIGATGARKGATGYDLSDPQDIRDFYNSNRIPMYNNIMGMVEDFGRMAAGEPPLNAQGLVVGTDETPHAWYRRMAVFYGTQVSKIERSSGGSSMVGSQAQSAGFGQRRGSRGGGGVETGIYYDSQTQRLDTFGLNPYAQTERGNMGALHGVLNDAIADGIFSEWFAANERVTLDDLKFVLHHMGSVNALYDDLLTNPDLFVNEYSEIMAYDNGGGEWTLVINFGMNGTTGLFNPLGERDVAIIPNSLEQIYMSAVQTSSQLENDNALDAAVIQVGMSRMRGWLIPETSKARMVQKSHRFTCKADAAIPAQMNALIEIFMMVSDSAAKTYIDNLQSDMRGVSESFSGLLRGSVMGQLKGRWPTYAWGSGAAGPHGPYGSTNPDLLHSPPQRPPSAFVGPRADIGVAFYPQVGDPYFETREEYASRIATLSSGYSGNFGWPGAWYEKESAMRGGSQADLEKAVEGAEGLAAMTGSLGKGAGEELQRIEMKAKFGETNWLDAMSEGLSVFGTNIGQEEAARRMPGRGTGGYFRVEEYTVPGRGVLAGQVTPAHIAERPNMIASRYLQQSWIPNQPGKQASANAGQLGQGKNMTGADLGFLWALPYAIWGYPQLGGSKA